MEFGTFFFKQILRVGDNIWPICHNFEMETRWKFAFTTIIFVLLCQAIYRKGSNVLTVWDSNVLHLRICIFFNTEQGLRL